MSKCTPCEQKARDAARAAARTSQVKAKAASADTFDYHSVAPPRARRSRARISGPRSSNAPFAVALEDRRPARVIEDWALQQSGHLMDTPSGHAAIMGTCSCNGETYLVVLDHGDEVEIPYDGSYCGGYVGTIIEGPNRRRIGSRVFVERAW